MTEILITFKWYGNFETCHLFKSLDVMNLTARSVVLPFRIVWFLCLYMFIYMCIYIYTSTRMYIYIYIYLFTYVHTYNYRGMCVYMYSSIYSHILDCALSFSLIKTILDPWSFFMGSSPGGWGKQLSESGSHGALFADPQDLLPDGQVTVGYGNYLQFRSLKWSLMFLCVFFWVELEHEDDLFKAVWPNMRKFLHLLAAPALWPAACGMQAVVQMDTQFGWLKWSFWAKKCVP